MNGVPNTPEAETPSPAGLHRHAAYDFVELWLAPGPRQAELERVLEALHPGRCAALADLYEAPLAVATATPGARAPTLLLDADHLALEDIGWIRRLVATGRIGAVVAVGTDPGAVAGRALRSLPALAWTPWPPDLNEIKSWLPAASGAPAPRASAGPGASVALDVESGVPGALPSLARASAPSPAIPAQAEHFAAAVTASAASSPAPSTAAVLGLGRDQVAVLADISQRLELAFLALRESGRADEAEMEAPQIELRRLMRFTRSLACLAAPPPRGVDEFDVAGLIEELLATLTLRGRKGPRFQPSAGPGGRPAVEFFVRADRAALAMAFETVLSLARLCASGGDTVRVSYTPINGSAVAIAVEFPAGPLQGLDPRQLLDSALLRERLPELGPSELAAASSILTSQGGSLEFGAPGEGQLAVRMRVPIERAPKLPAAQPAPARAGRGQRGRGDDPFA